MTARNRLAEAFARMNASRDHDEIIRARGDVFDAVASLLVEEAAPQPQASAEDITRIQSILYRAFVYRQDEEAWQRIRTDMLRLLGVGS